MNYLIPITAIGLAVSSLITWLPSSLDHQSPSGHAPPVTSTSVQTKLSQDENAWREQAQIAIDHGVDHLLKMQREDGSWKGSSDTETLNITSMTVVALVHAPETAVENRAAVPLEAGVLMAQKISAGKPSTYAKRLLYACACRAASQPKIQDADHHLPDWRFELIKELAAFQDEEGSWSEHTPISADDTTSSIFAILALENVRDDLLKQQ